MKVFTGAAAASVVLMCSAAIERFTAAQNTLGEATRQQPQQGAGSGGALDALIVTERQDFGIAPVAALHAGEMHAPRPSSIPGGQVITTKGLVELLRGGRVPVLTLDILGGQEMIQGAVYAIHQPGLHERAVVPRRHRVVEEGRPAGQRSDSQRAALSKTLSSVRYRTVAPASGGHASPTLEGLSPSWHCADERNSRSLELQE